MFSKKSDLSLNESMSSSLEKYKNVAYLCLASLTVGTTAAQASGYDTALELFKAGKYDQAAEEFRDLTVDNPGYAYAFYMTGLSLMKTGEFAEAISFLETAISLQNDKFGYHFNLALSKTQMKDFAGAVAALDRAESLLPKKNKYSFYRLRGSGHLSLGNWTEAVSDLEKARTIQKAPALLVRLAQGYRALGNKNLAIERFREAEKLDPENTTITKELAETLLSQAAQAPSPRERQSLYAEAQDSAEAVLAAKPNDFETLFLVGQASLGARDFERAIQAFDRAATLSPANAAALLHLGKAYSAQGYWQKSEEALQKASLLDPPNARVWEAYGFAIHKQASALQAEGEREKAITRFHEAIAAYAKAQQLEPSEFLTSSIDTCEKNIEVIKENRRTDELNAQRQKEIDEQKAKEKKLQEKIDRWDTVTGEKSDKRRKKDKSDKE